MAQTELLGLNVDIGGGIACQVHVLGGDLPVVCQLLDQFLGGQEPPLPVGDGHGVHLPGLGVHEPGGLVGGHRVCTRWDCLPMVLKVRVGQCLPVSTISRRAPGPV